ncbi:lojap-related protein [Wolffia australiana]
MSAAARWRALAISSKILPLPRRWSDLLFSRGLGSLSAPDLKRCLELEEIEKVLNDVKAGDVRVIPVGKQCGWTDHMVVATGKSAWHVRNIAQALIYKAKQKQRGADRMLLPRIEGQDGGNWIVVDAGSVIVHALDEKARSYYNLENLWTEEKLPEGNNNQELVRAFKKTRPENNSKKRAEK